MRWKTHDYGGDGQLDHLITFQSKSNKCNAAFRRNISSLSVGIMVVSCHYEVTLAKYYD